MLENSVVIVGALSLATALENSGVIMTMTEALMPVLSGTNWFIALVIIYLITLLLTEFVTNNAAAALMFPFAYGLVQFFAVLNSFLSQMKIFLSLSLLVHQQWMK